MRGARALACSYIGRRNSEKKRTAYTVLNDFQKIFAVQVINNWNTLSQKVVPAPSLNVFKTALDKFWGKTAQLNLILKQIVEFGMTC